MKKAFSFFLTFCFVLAMPFMLTSCSDHNFSTDWSYNEESHWHACLDEKCEEVSDSTSHNWVVDSQTNEKVFYKCSVCPATKTHTHSKSTDWTTDETHHWKTCTTDNCQEKFDKNEHNWDSGVTEGFDTVYTCLTCNQTKTETESHTHTTSDVWEKDQTNHWKVCTDSRCGEKVELDEHTWGEPVINGDVQTLTCSVCKLEKTESYVPGHTHEYSDWSTDDTHHWKECIGTDCEEKIEYAQHEWNEGSTEDGTVTYTCKVCNKTQGHTHTYSGSWVKDEDFHWKRCDEFGCEEKGEKETHTWDAGVTSGDTVTYTCLICEGTKQHTHSYSNTWVKDETHHWKVCEKDNCGAPTQKIAHTWDKGAVKGDKILYTCTACLETKEEDYVAPEVPVQEYVLKLTDFVITSESANYKINVGELYYNVNEDGNLVGYGVCTLADPYTNTILTNANIILDGNNMYIYNKNLLEDYSEVYIKMSLAEMSSSYVTLLENRFDMTFEEMQEYIAGYQETINSVMQAISGFFTENSEAINSLKTALMNELFTSTVSETDVTYTFNYDAFKKLNSYLNTTELQVVFNTIFGENSFTALKDFLNGSLEVTMGELITTLESNGVVIEDVLSYLDIFANYAYQFMGTSSSTPSTGVVPMSEGSSSESVPAETITFEEFLAMLGYELPVEDIEEIISDDNFKALTVTDILNMLTETEQTATDYEVMINGLFTTYGEMTVYEIIAELATVNMTEVKNSIDSYVDMFSQILTISYVTDKNDVILNVSVNVNIPGIISGKIEYIKDYESTVDYEALKEEYQTVLNSYKFTKDMLPESLEGYTKTETIEGENTKVSYSYINGSKTEIGSYEFVEYVFVFNANNELIEVQISKESQYSYDSEGTIVISYSYSSSASLNIEDGYYSLYINDVCKENFVEITISSSKGTYVYSYGEEMYESNGYSFEFYYDEQNDKISLDMDFNDEYHSFVEIESDKVTTEYGYFLHLVCENCGEDCYVQALTTLPSNQQYDLTEYILNNYTENSITDYYYVYYTIVYEYDMDTGLWTISSDVSVDDLEYTYDSNWNYDIYTTKVA